MELIQKNVLLEQAKNIDSKSVYYVKSSKKIHIGALYDLCKNLARDGTSLSPLMDLEIFVPESGERFLVKLILIIEFSFINGDLILEDAEET